MANVKLSELPALSTMTNAAVVPVVEGGVTKIVTGTALKTYTRTTDVNASELLGTTLPSSIVTSSLTSVGTITSLTATSLTVTNPIIRVVPILTRKHSVAQNLLTDTATRVVFNTVSDSVNTTGITYDGSSNPGRFTNTSGATRVFTVSTTVEFNQTSTAGHRIAWILKNSNERVAQQSQVAATQNGGTGNETTVLNLSVPIVLDNNEFFEVWSYQDSGGTLTIGAGGDFGGSYISIIWN
jgi:hypothetical protein